MASFLQRMIRKSGDDARDRHGATIAEEHRILRSESEAKRISGVGGGDRSRSAAAAAGQRRAPSSKLFGASSRRGRWVRDVGAPASAAESSESSESSESAESADEGPKESPAATRLIEEVVREFEARYRCDESPTEGSAPSKRSRNFVKRLVAALERRQRDCCGEAAAGVPTTPRSHSVVDSADGQQPHDRENRKHEEDEESTRPKVVGAFLKEPIEIQRTPVYWIPITAGEKLPRKKSFKKFLAKLTGRGGGGGKASEARAEQVVFASQENLIGETHGGDSGYEGRSSASSGASSLASFADAPTYRGDMDCVDGASYKDCNFSTFATSSPVKKTSSSRFAEVEESREEDSAIFNDGGGDSTTIPRKDLVPTRVRQISYQLAKLPKHPFAKSEPRLCGRGDADDRHSSGDVVGLRRRRRGRRRRTSDDDGSDGSDGIVYDVPRPRPRSSVFDESLSVRRRRKGAGRRPAFPACESDEEPHYATVRPTRGIGSRVGRDDLRGSCARDRPSHTFADSTANESFVVTMYV